MSILDREDIPYNNFFKEFKPHITVKYSHTLMYDHEIPEIKFDVDTLILLLGNMYEDNATYFAKLS
jgi:hypothetical protein